MIAAVVLELHALKPGKLLNSSGTAAHGVWFRQLAELDETLSAALHATPSGARPFALSPLMGLPPARAGVSSFVAGQTAWLRVCTLDVVLTRLLPDWLAALPDELEIGGTCWQICARAVNARQHSWAGSASYLELRERAFARDPAPHRWTVAFSSPTAFNGARALFPFPLPDSILASWLRRWNAFSSFPGWPNFSEAELKAAGRQFLTVESYRLHTVNVHMRAETLPGCLGEITYCARCMPPEVRQTVDVLMDYAFFCGSGYKTTQGWGQTRLLKRV